MDESLERLKNLVEKELGKIAAKGDITPAELEIATKAVCLIEKIKMVEDLSSEDMYSSRSYRSNGSYRRNGNSNNGSYNDYYNQDRSYNDRDYNNSTARGYSRHSVRDRMISHLESTMMDNAQSESERRVIESLISQLGSETY